MGEELLRCDYCDNVEIVYECRICGELFCEDCLVAYDQFAMIDYDICVNCFDAKREG